MESDSRFSYGEDPSSFFRMDRPMDQFMTIPQHSTLTQPRMATGGVIPVDLTSAIQHELRRSSGISSSHGASSHDGADHNNSSSTFPVYDSFLLGDHPHHHHSHHGHYLSLPQQQMIPRHIPRFDEGSAPLGGFPSGARFGFGSPVTESLGSAHHHGVGMYSSRSADGLPQQSHHGQQMFDSTAARADQSMRSCSSWIERMMQADVTPTPTPINLSNSTSFRSHWDVSCMASQTVDLQSCRSSDIQQRSAQSILSAFSSEPLNDSTVEFSADLCTDDDDQDTRPMDVKRKKRVWDDEQDVIQPGVRATFPTTTSGASRPVRSSAVTLQTAKLRVENSTLQKLSATVQVAKKFEDQNKDLLKKVDRLSEELELGAQGAKKSRKSISATANNNNNHNDFNDCDNCSQQTAFASSCEMVGERPLRLDPTLMRDNSSTAPSLSLSSSPNRPSPPKNEEETEALSNGNNHNRNNASSQIGPVCRSFSLCRVEKKRSSNQSQSQASPSHSPTPYGRSSSPNNHHMAYEGSHQQQQQQPRRIAGGTTTTSSAWQDEGYTDPLDFQDDGMGDRAAADRWLDFPECFL